MKRETPAVEISLNLVHWVIGIHISFDDEDDSLLLIGVGPLSIAISKPRNWGWWARPMLLAILVVTFMLALASWHYLGHGTPKIHHWRGPDDLRP